MHLRVNKDGVSASSEKQQLSEVDNENAQRHLRQLSCH
jgi:hypothetical protein